MALPFLLHMRRSTEAVVSEWKNAPHSLESAPSKVNLGTRDFHPSASVLWKRWLYII
jgi:hypothetical protein